jgi:hypothetical protein
VALVIVAEAPEAEVAPPRIAVNVDSGIVRDPPSVPPEKVIVNGLLPPVAIVTALSVALNVPVAEIAPVNVAVPEATYEVPEDVNVALTVSVALLVAACAATQMKKTVRTRNIVFPP